MDCRTPGFPVHQQLPEPTQTHVHCISGAIKSSHLLSSPSLPTFNLYRKQGSMSHFFASDGQSIRVSASESVFPMNIQDWFSLGWTGWISLQSKGLSRVFNTTVQKHQFFGAQLSLFFLFFFFHCFPCKVTSWTNSVTLNPYMTAEKTTALTRWTFVGKVMSLLFNMRSRLVIGFLPRSECLLISWLQLPSAVILEPKKIKSLTVSIFSPTICHEVMGLGAMIFVFWMFSFKPTFSLSSFTFIKRLLSSSSLSAIRVVSCAYLRLFIFLLAVLISACASPSLTFHMIHSA